MVAFHGCTGPHIASAWTHRRVRSLPRRLCAHVLHCHGHGCDHLERLLRCSRPLGMKCAVDVIGSRVLPPLRRSGFVSSHTCRKGPSLSFVLIGCRWGRGEKDPKDSRRKEAEVLKPFVRPNKGKEAQVEAQRRCAGDGRTCRVPCQS